MSLARRPIAVVLGTIAAVLTTGSMASSHNTRLNQVQSLAASGGEKTIVGTWRTHVRPRNCETDEVAPVGLRGLFSFHEGGTLSEYGIGPGLTPALRSPGHGDWQRLPGWDEYTYAFTFYRYDAMGNVIGSTRVRSALRLAQRGDAFSSNSEVEVLDANDGLLMTACARADGTRFKY